MLGQHWKGILPIQCCPNTFETTLDKKTTCVMLAQSWRFHREIGYTMLSWYACANIAKENYLGNVDPQPMNNMAQKNNLQCCLDLCRLTLCKEISCAMLTYGYQTTFLSKIIYAMLCLSSWNNIAYKYRILNAVQIRLRQHCTRKLLAQ